MNMSERAKKQLERCLIGAGGNAADPARGDK